MGESTFKIPGMLGGLFGFSSKEGSGMPAEIVTSKEKGIDQIGVFSLTDKSVVTRDFAQYLTDEHAEHASSHESHISPEDKGKLAIREATKEEYAVIEELFTSTYAPSHAERFGAQVNGVIIFGEGTKIDENFAPSKWPNVSPSQSFPANADIVGWHGTSASRAAEIMAKGFRKIDEKKSGHPMYGDGAVYFAQDSSKSMGYFHPGYYNDRNPYKKGGVMFLVRPKLSDKDVYVAGDALWGNRVKTADGKTIEDWRDQYSGVYALSNKDPGIGSGRPNFREMCVSDPNDVEILAAVWVELVPQGDSRHDASSPVEFPEMPEPQEPAKKVESVEVKNPITSLDKALESLPYTEKKPRILKRSILEPDGMCESKDHNFPYNGLELRRGDCVTFTLPESQHGTVLDSLVVLHRKDRQYNGSVRRNITVNGVFREVSDTEGAYTRIFVFDENTKNWVFWPDPYKGQGDPNYGAKYAEPRSPSSPEVECLYDWLRAGNIKPSHIVAMGWGKGQNAVTNFHGLEVGVFPPEGLKSKQEYIFTQGTRFVTEGMKKPTYGGGSGNYPDAVRLDGYGNKAKLPSNCSVDSSGRLHIKMTEELDLSRLEVACGDTHPDGKTLGWAKLNADAVLHSKGSETHSLIKRQNVPPEGVLKGSPTEKLKLSVGDEIILSANDDTNLYVMGVRLQ